MNREVINGELTERVDDFASLRAGQTVWLKHCVRCNGRHRGMLVKLLRDAWFIPADGRAFATDGWEMLPASKCGRAFSVKYIATGLVYRVVDEGVTEAGETRARELEVVR